MIYALRKISCKKSIVCNYTIIMDIDLVKFRALKMRLQREGRLELRVASTSMEPIIWKDQLVIAEKADPQELEKFDIIIFWQQQKIFCHLLWHIQKDANNQNIFITKSLENPREIDIPLQEELLLGKVNVTIPLRFKLIMWLKNFRND